MARKYIVFGSDDKVNWEMLDTVTVSGAAAALSKGREQESHRHYAATPERNWTWGTPQVVERPPVVKWETITPGQMTVQEVLDEPPAAPPPEPPSAEKDKEGLLDKARTALAGDDK